MKLPLADFYLIRIAFLDSKMAKKGGDIYDYLTIIAESERTSVLERLPAKKRKVMVEFRADAMMFAAMGPSSILNRVFTWEEYSAIQGEGKFVFIPDDYIETQHPVEAEISHFAATLRRFIEPMLKKSFENMAR